MGNTPQRRSSYFSGCISPPCVPLHDQYERVDPSTHSNGSDLWSRRWRKLINKVVRESKKSIYGSSKPLTFRYDAVSYSQNFDDGNHRCEFYDLHGHRCSQVIADSLQLVFSAYRDSFQLSLANVVNEFCKTSFVG
ncbi:hypothetical protein Ccrd_018945 [Cynara cardunculus var. scolymus]|uniref:Uncharacterized protein n=1 Tax=Cynara cardunculus var. scolymus TaxID=59895 RepID=A0A103Y583_CYNCS|nr:hypothetical protein Ccrd_018945 [Cynara cardunculus var. scolymus]